MIAACDEASLLFLFLLLLPLPLLPAILTVLGNVAVLVSSGRRPTLLKGPELLAVNLALADLGMALSMYPLSIAAAFNHGWIGGDRTCLYYGMMGMVFSVASIMTLAALGTVRYLVTGNPPKTGRHGRHIDVVRVVEHGETNGNYGGDQRSPRRASNAGFLNPGSADP